MGWLALWIISLGALIIAGFLGFLSLTVYILGLIILAFFAFLLVWFVLAPRNYFFTFVKEGSAKIVVKGDQFDKALIQWEGRTFNYSADGEEKWNVIEGKEPWHPFGGLRYYGFWPIKAIYGYWFQGSGIGEDGKFVRHPKELLDYVLLKDNLYYIELKDAEDKDMVPLTIGLLLTIRVVNPYKALFNVQNWFELVINRTMPLFREYIARHTYAELISKSQAIGGEIWQELAVVGKIAEFERDYGIHIKEGGIEMRDIVPREEYQRAATLEYLAERTKKRRAIETVGTVIESMAQARGKTKEEIQTLIEIDPTLQREFLELTKDLVARTMAIEGQSFLDLRVAGAEGMEKSLLELLAAWKRMPTGGPKKGEPSAKQPERKKESFQETVERIKRKKE